MKRRSAISLGWTRQKRYSIRKIFDVIWFFGNDVLIGERDLPGAEMGC